MTKRFWANRGLGGLILVLLAGGLTGCKIPRPPPVPGPIQPPPPPGTGK